jgi:hypothetical protein
VLRAKRKTRGEVALFALSQYCSPVQQISHFFRAKIYVSLVSTQFLLERTFPVIRVAKWFSVLLILGALGATKATAQVSASSCSTAAVQSAINSASEGQTVTIPAGTCIWASGVTISGKGIALQGAGSGRIIAYSSTSLALATGTQTLDVTSALVNGALSINPGESLKISELGNRQNYLVGTVASYSGGTLVMSVSTVAGACGSSSSTQSPSNCRRWLISTPPATILINNSSTTMFSVTEDSSFHTTLGGFKIQEGTGSGDGVDFVAGGGQAIVLQNCWIEQGSGDSVHTAVNRGLVSNCSFDSTPFSMAPLAVHLQPYDLTAWSTASYFGMNDTNGQHNFYVETSDFHAYLNATDNDEGARSVWRYSTFNNAGFGTHGADTGPIGERYFEFYNNTGVYNGYSDGTTFPMNWWMFVRGGTYVIFDNTLPALVSTDYGTKSDVNMTVMNLQRNAGPNPCWGAGTSGGADYFAPHQVGRGYVNGLIKDILGLATYSIASYGYSTPQYVGDLEPGYIWGNSRQPLTNVGTSDYGLNQSNSCSGSTYDTSANYIVAGRDYFNGSTPKPGYTPYTYPHPLASGSNEGSGTPPAAPTGLTATVE